MIGLVLVTHGRLGEEMVHVLRHVHGPQEQTAVVSIGPDDDGDARRADILAAVKKVHSGKGAVIMTDMFGGTPCNLAIAVAAQADAEKIPTDVIAGVNVPMLVKFASVRSTHKLEEAVAEAKAAGIRYIIVASDTFKNSSAA